MKDQTTKIYRLPENYIRRQRITSFVNANRANGSFLLCWLIHGRSGNLMGFYCREKNSKSKDENNVLWKSWEEKDFKPTDDCLKHTDVDDFLGCLKASKESHCTEYLPWFLGIKNNPPAKPEGKIMSFFKELDGEFRSYLWNIRLYREAQECFQRLGLYSFTDCLKADPKTLQKIPGVGPKKAARILWRAGLDQSLNSKAQGN